MKKTKVFSIVRSQLSRHKMRLILLVIVCSELFKYLGGDLEGP